MKLVTSWTEIRRNLLTLDGYRSSADRDLRGFYKEIIQHGHCFVRCQVGSRVLFGPSRFIGYQHNTKSKHENNFEKHGGITNSRIESRLRVRFVPSKTIDISFRDFCLGFGFEPEKRTRRFIDYKDSIHLDEPDLVHEDLEEIRRNRTLTVTEKKRLSLSRLGQGDFRRRVLDYWHRCPVTGLGLESLLRASHIRPWRHSTNAERLDSFNGLLLSPQADAAFDRGMISFDRNGRLLLSSRLPNREAALLGLNARRKIRCTAKHQQYLEYHRKHIFAS